MDSRSWRTPAVRKVIVPEHISPDSVIQAPDGPEEDERGDFSVGRNRPEQ